MNQVAIIVAGQSMTLVNNAIQGRLFVPNDMLEQIPKSERLEVFRCYGSGRFTPVWVEGSLKELSYAWEKMPVFSLSKNTHIYKGEDYPIADGFKMVDVEPAIPLKAYPANKVFTDSYNWLLPDIIDKRLKEIKASKNCLSLLDTFYCFDEEAVEAFEPVYNSIAEKLQKELDNWKARQELKVGEIFLTLKVEDVEKNPNGTATFHFEDGSYLHENYYWELYDTEIPENAEKVRFQWGNIEYLINGEWTDDPEEDEIDF